MNSPKPKHLALAIAAAMMSPAAAISDALIRGLAAARQQRVTAMAGYTMASSRQRSKHTVAQDKRAARKARNRAKAKRRYHG